MILQRCKTTANITASHWQDCREEIMQVNPDFAAIIDEIDPPKDFRIYRGEFSYGHKIVHRGVLHLPDKEGINYPITSSHLDSRIRDDLAYNANSNPVSMVLNNSVEMYLQLEDRIIPAVQPLQTGTLFGVWRIMSPGTRSHPSFLWELSSGVRSIFMLPKISDTKSHARLKRKYNIAIHKPRDYLEHSKLFSALANHEAFSQPWTSKIAMFSKKWFDYLKDPAWNKLYVFLLSQAWDSSSNWRDKFLWDFIFSYIEKEKDLKPTPYIAKVVKHLLSVATNSACGFEPATNSKLAPIEGLQRLYIEDYGLKQYPPIIMQPHYFDMYTDNSLPVYTSLQVPTQLEFASKHSERTSTIQNLHIAGTLLKQYVQQLKQGDYLIENTSYYDLHEKVQFDFFHSAAADYHDVRGSDLIPEQDERFFHSLVETSNKDFPTNNTFIRGCTRIMCK